MQLIINRKLSARLHKCSVSCRFIMEDLKEKVKEILKQHNIKISIGGCGCCGSPWVSFEKDGVKIVDNIDYFKIDMFEDDKLSENGS